MNRSNSIVMIGAPESGKTNYLARVWEEMRGEKGPLRATRTDDDIVYVMDALSHLLQGKFAPRTEKGVEMVRGCSVEVAWEREGRTEQAELVMPDVNGELWERAVETNELPEEWLQSVRGSVGALVFVRVASSVNRPSLDWVTAGELLRLDGAPEGVSKQGMGIPTDVQLCEFLRFLEYALGKGTAVRRPRVAVMVTAWDMVDAGRAQQGPAHYLSEEFPLFAGRLGDVSKVEVGVFGVSVVGGDFSDTDFRERFLASEIGEFGFVVGEAVAEQPKLNVTTPLQWILDGSVWR